MLNNVKPKNDLESEEFDKKLEDFKCVVCYDYFTLNGEGQEKKCKKCVATYCSSCWQKVRDKKCCVCKTESLRNVIPAEKLEIDSVLNFNTVCPNCDQEMTVEELYEHLQNPDNCLNLKMKCPFDGKEFQILDCERHFKDCQEKKVQCTYCKRFMLSRESLRHKCEPLDYIIDANPKLDFPDFLNPMIKTTIISHFQKRLNLSDEKVLEELNEKLKMIEKYDDDDDYVSEDGQVHHYAQVIMLNGS